VSLQVFFYQPQHRCTLEKVSPLPGMSRDPDDCFTTWVVTVTVLRPGRWDCPIPDDKSTCPGRPPLYVFPERMISPTLVEGQAVLTELFVLLPLTGTCLVGQVHRVVFKAKSPWVL